MTKKILIITVLLGVFLTPSKIIAAPKKNKDITEECTIASYYASKFHGRKTASGEKFNMHDLTAAHKLIKFGTRLNVKNQKTGKSVVVKVNDRGPFVKGRGLDLSKAAAKKIGMIESGHAKVCYNVM